MLNKVRLMTSCSQKIGKLTRVAQINLVFSSKCLKDILINTH